LLILGAVGAGAAAAEELRTFGPAEMAAWDYPRGLVDVDSGGVRVRPFTGPYNAMTDADRYRSVVIGEHGKQRFRSASNAATAPLLGDQNLSTWWRPDPTDPVTRWWVEIDLGRCVVASRIRVIFPDTLDVRPFQFFSLYVSPGISVQTAPDQIRYTRVGRPVNNNARRVIDFDLRTVDPAVATGQYLVTGDTLDFDLVRFVRFEAGGVTAGAAVAEIEVETVGINIATRVTTADKAERGFELWGGSTWTSGEWVCNPCGRGTGAEGIIDGDMDGRYWTIEANNLPDWRTLGNWGVIDMRHIFRLSRMVWVPNVLDESPYLYCCDRQRQGGWRDVEFLVSDGSPSNLTVADAEGPFEYKLLSKIINNTAPLRWLFDLELPSTEARLIFWRRMDVTGSSSWHRAAQLFIFPALGYPKEVVIESGDIDLGGAYSVRQVRWDADMPPGTRIHVETQTGNGYVTVERYYLANGVEVTKAEWEAAKPRQRGAVVQDVVRDGSWSRWSLPHMYSGQEFLSPTPRRWVRLLVRLISDDPAVMPVLRSLTFVMNSPVIARGVSGRLEPRLAALDTLQSFRYTLWPNEFTASDAGLDRVIIKVPPAATDTDLLRVIVGGREVAATGQLRGDSLVVSLPAPAVRRDTVVVEFRSRVYRSPTVFDAFVSNSAQADNVQGVTAAALGLDQVFVPQVEQVASLFQNVTHTTVFTPNGDGTNDVCELSFNTVNTAREPVVRVLALTGEEVSVLVNSGSVVGRARYCWNGESRAGGLVPPGIYLIRMEISTDAGEQAATRLVHVVY